MKVLILIGAPLLALGIAGVIWGVVSMADDRDSIDVGDVHIVVDEGEFPPIGIAGAIAAGVGVVLIAVGVMAGKKR